MLSYKIYAVIRRIADIFVVQILRLYHGGHVERIPQPKNKLLLDSAVCLAKKIKTKKVTSYEVVKAFIDRINQVNPLINAVVDDRFEEALAEAKEIDKKLENNEFGEEVLKRMPFLGVPFTTKDTTSCKGLSWTYGLVARKGMKGSEDAPCISDLKQAGAVLLGVTNVPELNMWIETYNKVYGTTKNPYDIRRNVGGSSGGEGSVIAALGSPMGIGTDIAGSIRIPSFYCGLFGHKPSNDIISTKGLTHRKGTEGPTMVVAGPMVKYSEDLLPFLKVLTRNAPVLKLDDPVDVRKVKIFYTTTINSWSNSPISQEVKTSVLKCVNHFKEVANMPPKEVQLDDLKHGVELWKYMSIKEKGSDYHMQLSNNRYKVDFYSEFFKYLTGRSDFTLYTLYVLFARIKPSLDIPWCEKTLNKLKKDLMEYLGDDGVLILPPESELASYHYRSILQPCFPAIFFVVSALKFPVTQVPMGLNSDGIPLGVQVVTTPNNDRLSIAVARELEQAFGGYVQPL